MTGKKKLSDEKNLYIRITPQFEIIWNRLKNEIMPASDAELFRTILKDYFKNKFGEDELKKVLLSKDESESETNG